MHIERMMEFLLSITFLCILFLNNVSSSLAFNSTWWPCHTTTWQSNVDLNKISGQWYLQQTISPSSKSTPANICAGLKLERTENGFLSIGTENKAGQPITFENETIIVEDPISNPGLWDRPDIGSTSMIIDLPTDRSSLTISICHRFLRFDWTGVFTRTLDFPSHQLAAVNQRLVNAGLQNVDSAHKLDTTKCSSVVESTKEDKTAPGAAETKH